MLREVQNFHNAVQELKQVVDQFTCEHDSVTCEIEDAAYKDTTTPIRVYTCDFCGYEWVEDYNETLQERADDLRDAMREDGICV